MTAATTRIPPSGGLVEKQCEISMHHEISEEICSRFQHDMPSKVCATSFFLKEI